MPNAYWAEPYHIFGEDLKLGPNGDLALVNGAERTIQRIIRRLSTNQGDYIWNLKYGAGLPARVGQKANAAAIAAVVRSQIFQEGSVAKTPQPRIAVQVYATGLVVCTITYFDNSIQQLVTARVNLGG